VSRAQRKGGHGGARAVSIKERAVVLELYTPHPGQARLHRSQARFRCACCGRRWGKTVGCVNEVAKFAWENPGNETTNVSWWVAPTYNQALKAMNLMANNFAPAIDNVRRAIGQMQIKWKNGSVTSFMSAERYDNLRGEGVTFMVIDEAAMIPREAWEKVLRPMLTDTMARALLISTPRGKNWFYALYKRGEDPEQTDYESFSFPTASSPYIPASEIEEARETLPEDVFAQEYAGRFLEEAAGVFHGVEACIYGEFEDPHLGKATDSERKRHRYVIGWDIAKARDWSVVSVMDCDYAREGGIIAPHLAHWERFNSLRYDVQIERVAAIARQYDAYVLLDSTGLGDPVYDMMLSKGVPCVPYVFTSKSKQMLIQNLQIAIQTQSVSYPEVPVLLQELGAFQYSVAPSGNMLYSAPEGDHDDCVISLALGVWAAQHPLWAQEQVIYDREEDEVISPI